MYITLFTVAIPANHIPVNPGNFLKLLRISNIFKALFYYLQRIYVQTPDILNLTGTISVFCIAAIFLITDLYAKLTINLHSLARLRMCGVIHPFHYIPV